MFIVRPCGHFCCLKNITTNLISRASATNSKHPNFNSLIAGKKNPIAQEWRIARWTFAMADFLLLKTNANDIGSESGSSVESFAVPFENVNCLGCCHPTTIHLQQEAGSRKLYSGCRWCRNDARQTALCSESKRARIPGFCLFSHYLFCHFRSKLFGH